MNVPEPNPLLDGIYIIVFVIALFFIFRKILLWYWKVDDLIKNQEKLNGLIVTQNELLKQISTMLENRREN